MNKSGDDSLKNFPFISLKNSLDLARIMTAIFFMAHAVVRIVNDTIPQFATFMESIGFPNGVIFVWLITIAELVSGTLLIINRCVRPASSILFTIAFVGIILIHRHNGWFVGEHGTGGSEYSIALMILLIIISANDREKARI